MTPLAPWSDDEKVRRNKRGREVIRGKKRGKEERMRRNRVCEEDGIMGKDTTKEQEEENGKKEEENKVTEE